MDNVRQAKIAEALKKRIGDVFDITCEKVAAGYSSVTALAEAFAQCRRECDEKIAAEEASVTEALTAS